jgi:hypothetical protein
MLVVGGASANSRRCAGVTVVHIAEAVLDRVVL